MSKYKNEEIETLYNRVHDGFKIMSNMSTKDENYTEYMVRFFDLLGYFLESLEPISDMRIIADKRNNEPVQQKMM